MLIAATEAWDVKCKQALLAEANPFCAQDEAQAQNNRDGPLDAATVTRR